MKVLGIETSCDETAASVVLDGRTILSNVVQTQVDLHGPFGGVVPEIASRRHIEVILPVVEEALTQCGLGLSDLDGIAVTRGPGLVGALLVGLNLAKAVGMVTGLPVVGINHIHGHVAAAFLETEPARFPVAAAVVSGGHTNLYLVEDPLHFKLLGQTRDDAAGEAFDKVAKLVGLGYPGGKAIDDLAAKGDPKRFPFPRPMLGKGLEFSFSGLKTAVINLVTGQYGDRAIPSADLADLAASFQAAVVDVLTHKIEALVKQVRTETLVLCGGVAANQGLRRETTRLADRFGIRLILPPINLCTDNGAMVAAIGYHHLRAGNYMDLAADAYSRWPAAI